MSHPATPRGDPRTVLLRALVGSLCLAALAGVLAILADASIDETAARVLVTAGALTLYSLAALAATSLVGRRPGFVWLSVLGLSSSAIGLVVTLGAIWLDQPGDDGLVRAAVALLIATLAISHAALLLRAPDERAPVFALRVVTILLGALIAVLTIFPLLLGGDDRFQEHAVAVTAVLFLLGNALLPVLRLMERRS